MKDHLFNWMEFVATAPSVSIWHYKWVEINLRLHAYIRYRNEDTLDGMSKPFTETLAYVQDIGQGSGWEWRAFKHVDEQVREMDIPHPQQYFKVTLQVEEIIQKELGQHQE
ncbi:hypothetical protein [Dyadobacter diqingensis]|uniref:hypothetical protein n=1 Tax=Dyadobacter diqingensis TaxID=2938121 RepID=UPI0020C587EF|nr:hypothetical protein [Dyadobacter diqingensis]